MITIKGFFGNYNSILTDTGEIFIAYPFGIDFFKVYQYSGYFLLKERDGNKKEYTVINYLIDDIQTLKDKKKYEETIYV